MEDGGKCGIRVWKSDCENILESDAYLIWDRLGKVLMLAGFCLCVEDMMKERASNLLMLAEEFWMTELTLCFLKKCGMITQITKSTPGTERF